MLELTESVLVRDSGTTRRHLPRLRALGIRIALDDFGTGYSSLSYLTTLSADTIKLDRSFVNREFAHASEIVESIIKMAHRIGLRVVAEGVETQLQNDRMIGFSCDELQGFFFSPPMPACNVPGFLQFHREVIRATEVEGLRPLAAA
jgi:EAL domain-containing protein (putative c-di-GMP-specific phosphodiesterase class I)